MKDIEKDYKDYKKWKAGAIQEIIAEPHEGLNDAIDFMYRHLLYFGYYNLSFKKEDIRVEGNRYYITLVERVDRGFLK